MKILTLLSRRKSVEQLQQEAGASRDFRRVLGLVAGSRPSVSAASSGSGASSYVDQCRWPPPRRDLPLHAVLHPLAGIASAAAALCYAEFAGMIPVTGSAYAYTVTRC